MCCSQEGASFRIDRDGGGLFGAKVWRTNLAELFCRAPETPHPAGRTPAPKPPLAHGSPDDAISATRDALRARRRELIVDLAPPSFGEPLTPLVEGVASMRAAGELNDGQAAAIRAVATARDYALVQGMPGTGKTTAIAALIRLLVGAGKSVLLTSFTHSAVDNVLLKLVGGVGDVGLLRIGRKERVKPALHAYTEEELSRGLTTIEDMDAVLMSPLLVATTSLGVGHPLFRRRRFDYCIVDEASQITLAVCLGPIASADRFVLVGDHYQLPPLVQSEAARAGGMDVSLFRRLCEAHPQAVTRLTAQYRMSAEVMALANVLIYERRLSCGTADVARNRLALPGHKDLWEQLRGGDIGDVGGGGGGGGNNPSSPGADATHAANPGANVACGAPLWLHAAIDPGQPVVFLDTDRVPAHEERRRGSLRNETEAKLVVLLARALVHCGVRQDGVGVMSPYVPGASIPPPRPSPFPILPFPNIPFPFPFPPPFPLCLYRDGLGCTAADSSGHT